jgi:hypothetical protein
MRSQPDPGAPRRASQERPCCDDDRPGTKPRSSRHRQICAVSRRIGPNAVGWAVRLATRPDHEWMAELEEAVVAVFGRAGAFERQIQRLRIRRLSTPPVACECGVAAIDQTDDTPPLLGRAAKLDGRRLHSLRRRFHSDSRKHFK